MILGDTMIPSDTMILLFKNAKHWNYQPQNLLRRQRGTVLLVVYWLSHCGAQRCAAQLHHKLCWPRVKVPANTRKASSPTWLKSVSIWEHLRPAELPHYPDCVPIPTRSSPIKWHFALCGSALLWFLAALNGELRTGLVLQDLLNRLWVSL